MQNTYKMSLALTFFFAAFDDSFDWSNENKPNEIKLGIVLVCFHTTIRFESLM